MSAGSGFFSSIQPRYCQIILKSSIWLISGVPVSATNRAFGDTARIPRESARTFFERCESLFLMKCASSTTIPLKPRRESHGDVPVENLVVDDHDVGERIDVVAIAVHDGRDALRRPLLDLARPVDLHDVRHDDDERIRARRLGGEQRLRGLAEARLIGEQVGAVTGPGALDEAALVTHELFAAGGRERAGLRAGPSTRLRRPTPSRTTGTAAR